MQYLVFITTYLDFILINANTMTNCYLAYILSVSLSDLRNKPLRICYYITTVITIMVFITLAIIDAGSINGFIRVGRYFSVNQPNAVICIILGIIESLLYLIIVPIVVYCACLILNVNIQIIFLAH